ncbi:Uncharacterised protein [Moraxella caprae]|uniref:PIN domain-containing protein n=1 Tax=Moraxella caprae TaxID=90240 RepID=A0A378R2K1_9GAMM|nr:hypothetical protein [Moraxella caprae]STZ09424.1 Uncharacterised protein [Moraxella caprae]
MIGLDTNILARYYVETTDNDIKTKKQRELSKYIIENSPNLFVSNTVIIEFEWTLRAVCKYDLQTIIIIY